MAGHFFFVYNDYRKQTEHGRKTTEFMKAIRLFQEL